MGVYLINKTNYIGKETNNYSNDLYIFSLNNNYKDYDIKVNSYIVEEDKEGYKVDFSKLEKYPIKLVRARNREANKKYPRINLTEEILKDSYLSLEEYKEEKQDFYLFSCISWEDKGRTPKQELFIGRYLNKYILIDLAIFGTSEGSHLTSNKNLKELKKMKITTLRELEELKSSLITLINKEYEIEEIKELIPEDYKLNRLSSETLEELKKAYNIHESIIKKLRLEILEGYNKALDYENLLIYDAKGNLSLK